MSSTPKDPTRDGRDPASSASPVVTAPPRPNVDQTLFGVAPATPPRPATPPAQEAGAPPSTPRPAPTSESAIVAAPVIPVSDGKGTHTSSAQPASAPVPAHSTEPRQPLDSESNRTALSSDYLSAARDLALERKTLPPALFAPSAAPAELAIAPVAPTPVVADPAPRNESLGYATQRSVAPPALSDLPPLAPGFALAPPQPGSAAPEPTRLPARSIASTMFDPPDLPLPAHELPPLPPEPHGAPASIGSLAPALATRFEPVPAPRAALSEQMLGAFAPVAAPDPVATRAAAPPSERVSGGNRSRSGRVGVALLAAIALAGVGFLAFSDSSPIANRLRAAWSGGPEQAPMAEAVSDEAIRARMLSVRAASELQRPEPPPSEPVVLPLLPPPSNATGLAGSPAMAKAPGQVSVSFASDDKPKAKAKASHKAKARRHKAATKPAPPVSN